MSAVPIWSLVHANEASTARKSGRNAGSRSTSFACGAGRAPVTTYRSVLPRTNCTPGSSAQPFQRRDRFDADRDEIAERPPHASTPCRVPSATTASNATRFPWMSEISPRRTHPACRTRRAPGIAVAAQWYLTRVSDTLAGWSCRRSSASTTTSSSPPHVWQTWLPREVPGEGPARRAQALGRVRAQARRQVREHRGPRRRCGATPGTTRTGSSTCTSGSSRSRSRRRPTATSSKFDRTKMVMDGAHLRRDAPRLLRARGAHRRTSSSTGSTARCRSRRSRASAARRSTRPTTRSSGSRASRPTTTGWSRSGASRRAA